MFSEQNLPSLDASSLNHSAAVKVIIADKIIASGGAIRFDEFMRIALYEPGLGYYVAGAEKFGPAGDFVTAPELGSLFASSLASQAQQVLSDYDSGEIVEFGGGSGKLALDILLALDALNSLPERYTIIELSPELRQRQERLIRDKSPDLVERVTWRSELPEKPIKGCVFANEVLDALPVRYFEIADGEVFEFWVEQAESDTRRDGQTDDLVSGFAWRKHPADTAILKFLNDSPEFEYCLDSPNYLFEIIPAIPLWIQDLDLVLESGLALLFDYGSGRAERYGPAYIEGSLRCFLQHRVHGDPLVYPGVQDITSSVDFTHVAEAAVDAGMRVSGYAEQAHFLTSCGILHKVTELQVGADEKSVLRLSEQLKTLLLPTKMGSRFKSIALTKGYDSALLGYSLRDQRHLL
jgi:SAM-dependent MidA family methyltransferase